MKILIADDDAVMCRRLEVPLSECGHEIVVCFNGTDAWNILQEPDAPRLAILDWMMPGLEGPEICRRVRQHETDRYTYMILLTVRVDQSDIIDGINSGADDYITKPFDMMELKARLNAAMRNLRVHEDLLAAQEMLREEAMRDGLTGTQNHVAIMETVKQEIARSSREQTEVSIAIIDLDKFKSVNDTHGHLFGDEVLREVVHRIKNHLRAYDTIGRCGGDEFLIVMPDCSLAEAKVVAERIREVILQTPVVADQKEFNQSISIGIATTKDVTFTRPNELIKNADEALYAAKRAGRNCVVAYSPDFAQGAAQ
ncbi:MAG: diguanylate cyclase [Phycisphaerae bacterium]|nr:diguanylate cyclase [Phycisphaerae bacterium]